MVIEDITNMENLDAENTQNQEQLSSQESVPVEIQDYSNLSSAELVSEMEKFCTSELVESCRKDIEKIHSLFYIKQKNEFLEARKQYVAEHDSAEGFVFESNEQAFKEVYGRIKELRLRIAEQKKVVLEKNLLVKNQIIDRLAKLIEMPESMTKTFAEFRTLQEEWKNSGEVDPKEEKAIWEKYHLQVAKFYDYVKIDRELRDLDQKKNYEAKTLLCEKAEALKDAKQVVKAFADLQVLHKEWREIGPVKEEFKEQLWERFKAATSVINKAHQDYFANIKKQEEENLQKKTALCEKMDEIITELDLTQKQWNAKTNQVLEIQKEWKTIGYAPQKQNTLIYERFSKACDVFFTARKSFFGDVREVENANKKRKVELCEKAESMQSRTDWKEASKAFVNLQKEWKTIGSTSFKDSQKLWTRFSTACNAFFDSRKAFEAQQNQKLADNIVEKEKIITEIAEFSSDVKDDVLNFLSEIQTKWSEILVPFEARASLQKKYSEAITTLLQKAKIEKEQAENLDFTSQMTALFLENGGEEKLLNEAKRLKKKLSAAVNEVNSIENNLGFFSKSSDATKLIASVEKNVAKGKKEIERLEQKLQIINSILKENR